MIMNVDNELIFHNYVVSMTEKGDGQGHNGAVE